MSKPRSLSLVDLSYVFKKAWHTAQATSTPHQRAQKAVEHIERLEQMVDHIVLCRDAKPYSRATLFPQYKAQRPEPEEGEVPQRRWFLEEMTRRGYPIAWVDGAEADDVIATLARLYSVWCEDVRIVGPDKDMCQCLNDRVAQYIPPERDKDWVVRDVKAAFEKFKVDPAKMPFYQGLLGDKTDNIPGVKGIGEVNAAKLVNTYHTPAALRAAILRNPQCEKPFIVKALQEQWAQLELSIQLATLDANLPIDAEALLVRGQAQPEAPRKNIMDRTPEPELVIERNDTPMPPPQNDVVFEEAKRLFQESRPAIEAAIAARENPETAVEPRPAQKPASATQILERYQVERDWAAAQNPNDFTKPFVPRRAEPQATSAIVVPEATQTKYGLVTRDLQPIDLESAYVISEWLIKGELFKQYKNEAQVFTIMLRAKELGIGVAGALAGHHIIEGKPVAHADLIRALAERSPDFEYLMPTEISATKCTWEGKNKRQPRPVSFSYTIEEARAAGLVRSGDMGKKPSNWILRPQDMLMKTAGSKLARILWPAATFGLYCPEEMGYSAEETGFREAA